MNSSLDNIELDESRVTAQREFKPETYVLLFK